VLPEKNFFFSGVPPPFGNQNGTPDKRCRLSEVFQIFDFRLAILDCKSVIGIPVIGNLENPPKGLPKLIY
jgi:hypothetical protein